MSAGDAITFWLENNTQPAMTTTIKLAAIAAIGRSIRRQVGIGTGIWARIVLSKWVVSTGTLLRRDNRFAINWSTGSS